MLVPQTQKLILNILNGLMDAVKNVGVGQILQKQSQFAGQQLFYLLRHSGTNIMSQQLHEQTQTFMFPMHEQITSLSDSIHENSSNISSIVNASFTALWKLSREFLLETPCHKLFNLSIQGVHKGHLCSKVSAKQMKDLLREAVFNSQTSIKGLQEHSPQFNQKGEIISSTRAVFSTQIVNKILKSQLSKTMEEVLAVFSLNYAIKSQSNHILFAWKQDLCLKIFDENIHKIQSCKNIQQIYGIINKGKTQACRNVWNYAQEDRQLLKFKLLLSRLNGELSIKHEIIQLFSKKCSKQRQNERQLQKWINCSSELNDTIKLQMQELEKQNIHNNQLKQQIQELNYQLSRSEQRIKQIQAEVLKISQELLQLKQPINIKQEAQENYYINPYYQKSQYEEKLFMEMIQTQSQLLLGKEQIKIMTESIIDLIKISLNTLEELQPSIYFLRSFGRAVLRSIKDIRSLESMDIQGLLNLKEDSQSLYDSEYFEQTRKSEISTFSEIQMDQKMSRLTEDDSLSLTNNDQ